MKSGVVEMKSARIKLFLPALAICCPPVSWGSSVLHLTEQDVLETQGLSILLFHNSYHRVFGGQKMSGL